MTVFQKIKFGDLYSTPSRNGVSKPSRIRGAGYPMVNMGEIFKYSRIDDSVDMELVPLSDIEMGNSFLENGDLLFARQSLVLEGAGKCSIFLGNSTKTTFESHLIRARLDINKTESQFYYYYFTSSPGKTKIRSIVNQVAAAGIRGSDLAKLVVDFPNLPTQTNIASVLSAYDDLIENNERRIKALEEIAQLLYTEWFVKFKFPGHEKVKMIESGTEYGMVPEGWEVTTFGNTLDIKYGKTLPTSKISEVEKYEVYGAGGIIGYYNQKNVDTKTALITCRGNGSGTVWRTFGEGFVTNNSFTVNSKNKRVAFEFVYSCLKGCNIAGSISGSAQPQITIENINFVKYILPPVEFIVAFVNKAKQLYELSDDLLKQNQNLSKTRDLLIPQLVTGRRELKQ